MPGAASKSKVGKVLPAGKPDWSRWRWMRREERSAISISRSEASRLAAGQPSRSEVSVRRFQLRLMLGRRKAFSRVGSTAAAWSVVRIISQPPRGRTGCGSCAVRVAGYGHGAEDLRVEGQRL